MLASIAVSSYMSADTTLFSMCILSPAVSLSCLLVVNDEMLASIAVSSYMSADTTLSSEMLMLAPAVYAPAGPFISTDAGLSNPPSLLQLITPSGETVGVNVTPRGPIMFIGSGFSLPPSFVQLITPEGETIGVNVVPSLPGVPVPPSWAIAFPFSSKPTT